MNPANRRFHVLHVTFSPAQPASAIAGAVERLLTGDATDWIRYADHSWLIWTDIAAQGWHELIRTKAPMLRDHRYLFLSVDISERQGLLPRQVWEWINKYDGLYRKALLDALAAGLTQESDDR